MALRSALYSVVVSLLLPTLVASEQLQHVLKDEDGSKHTCHLLQKTFPEQVLFPDTTEWLPKDRYWATQQAELSPACRFIPSTSQDVQQAVQLLVTHNTTLAIASGGHSSNTGASNIDSGITIDLLALESIKVVEDDNIESGKSVWVGPGARWDDVYATLEPHNLTVSGGRVSDVGVGGYVLGGGFSWFANGRGWTCDSVLEMEVVTPDGELFNISESEHGDLFWALKGSLGAIGVVTRIRVPALVDRKLYGGAMAYQANILGRVRRLDEVFAALEQSTHKASEDLETQAYLSLGWASRRPAVAFGSVVYAVNTAGNSSSPIIDRFKSIPHTNSSLRHMSMRESAQEIGMSNVRGLRRSKFSITAKCTVEAMQLVYNTFRIPAEGSVLPSGSMLGVTMQPLTVEHLAKQSNIFNLPPSEGPLLLVSAELWWSNDRQDRYCEALVLELWERLIEGLNEELQLHSFVYTNYAAKWQDPFLALSLRTKEKLRTVRERYDPDDVWRRLVPGIWHI